MNYGAKDNVEQTVISIVIEQKSRNERLNGPHTILLDAWVNLLEKRKRTNMIFKLSTNIQFITLDLPLNFILLHI